MLVSAFWNLTPRRLRDGLLLEDLDCFTADVAGRHIGAADAAHVTAALEEVRWLPAVAGAGGATGDSWEKDGWAGFIQSAEERM